MNAEERKKTEKIIRIKMPEVLYRKYKVICAQKDLSMPKQTHALIRKFIELFENTPF
jgi:hypothetical protein